MTMFCGFENMSLLKLKKVYFRNCSVSLRPNSVKWHFFGSSKKWTFWGRRSCISGIVVFNYHQTASDETFLRVWKHDFAEVGDVVFQSLCVQLPANSFMGQFFGVHRYERFGVDEVVHSKTMYSTITKQFLMTTFCGFQGHEVFEVDDVVFSK